MKKPGFFRMSKAQSTIEYSILVIIVAAAFIAMHTYAQRAVRASLKVLEKQINADPQ